MPARSHGRKNDHTRKQRNGDTQQTESPKRRDAQNSPYDMERWKAHQSRRVRVSGEPERQELRFSSSLGERGNRVVVMPRTNGGNKSEQRQSYGKRGQVGDQELPRVLQFSSKAGGQRANAEEWD